MLGRAALPMIVLALTGGRLFAQVPPEERIPVRDPDRLEALGFPRDASNVYVWSKAEPAGFRADDIEVAETWGTGVGYSTVYGYQMQAQSKYSDIARGYPSGSLDTFCGDPTGGAHAFAQIQVPEGASLGTFRFWAFDSDPVQDLWFRVWETCQPYGYDPPTTTLIAENQTLAAIGNIPGSKSLNNLTVNNRVCAYTVDVDFAGPPGEDCVGIALRVRKLQVSWTRQVSPAPATASFADVPTSHPFFPYVEALVKSGVTGGCGSGNYCPDSPLTRGQMAVFLAKALGLQWP